jgi:ribosome maturation factor RimP
MNRDLETVVEHEVDALGYDVVLLRRGGTRSRPVLEIRIDRRDGEPVRIADCVRVSRAVEARLDAGDAAAFGGGRYELQVSSPGDARRARDAQAAVERQAKPAG